MMISSKKYVDETLRYYNLKANKALGQNFLIESSIALEIIENLNITPLTLVIEIGPGLGALTEILLNKAKHVYAFEIDENMVKILKETFKDKDNFTLIHSDFLKVDLDLFLKEKIKDGYSDIKLVSNLPYYITSKLLNKILINNINISSVVTMMQKEVGLKIVNPDLKDMNLLSMILKYQYEVNIVKYVGKNSYLPRPEIDSIVLKFDLINPRFVVNKDVFIKVLKALYSTRRKTILNNLKELFSSKEELNKALETLSLNPSLRVEQLNIEDIIKICNYLG